MITGERGTVCQSLTVKQQAFVHAYIETGNGCEAYRRSYRATKMSARAVEVEASKLLRHPKVSLRLRHSQTAAAERHEVTVDSLTDMLRDAYDVAMAGESPAAAVTAVMAMAKLHGLLVERTHNVHAGPNGQPIRPILNVTVGRGATGEMTDHELREIAGLGGRSLNG